MPPREFRGVWIATVDNIDWPSKPGLPTSKAKAELEAQIKRAAALNLNAVVFQVRPAGDAMYRSELEPWSEWLTGKIGRPPAPNWDPLRFAIEQAHERGLELHAWFNPYRALHPANETKPVKPALAARRPELVKEYGPYLWMDPGEPAVRQHSLEVVLDVVRRYDVDGVHLDDYFYPYPRRQDGQPLPFPDQASWTAYRDQGGRLGRDAWRRENVNTFVRELYAGVKAIKPHVKVGISPFGIYRPGRPSYVQGFDQYARLYADPLLWLRQGWVDYLTPQLYWPIADPAQSFTGLLRWWVAHNPRQRHIWPGLAIYRHFNDAKQYPKDEFVHQVKWVRHLTKVSAGHVHFSMKWLMPGEKREPMANHLRSEVYRRPALVPATTWAAEASPPEPPTLKTVRLGGRQLEFTVAEEEPAQADAWLVQVRRDGDWRSWRVPASQPKVTIDVSGTAEGDDEASAGADKISAVAVRTIDAFGQVSTAKVTAPSPATVPTQPAQTQPPKTQETTASPWNRHAGGEAEQ
jgi:uncharacterized lipoprotein YddW (UPF0748 family)